MRFTSLISDLGPRVRIALVSVLAVLLVTLLYPFKTTIVPVWSLRVVDQTGTPVRVINVTEHWQHYLLESSGHEELRQTGDDGMVNFPDRTIRAGLLRRLLATVGRLTKEGTHAKRQSYASVVVWGSKDHSTTVAVYQDNQMPPAEIIAHSLR